MSLIVDLVWFFFSARYCFEFVCERGKRGGRRLYEYVCFDTFYSVGKELHKFNAPAR